MGGVRPGERGGWSRGRTKPFLLRLRTNVGLGAKEVLGAAPKLARTGARCGGVLLASERTMFEGCNNVGYLGKPGEKTLMHLLRDF